MNSFKEIKDRKVRKYLAIYISACITTLGLVHLFSFRYHLPNFIFDILLVVLFFGIITMFLFAWYHGKEGPQKIKKREYFFHGVTLVIAIVTAYYFSNRRPIKILPLNAKTVAVLPFKNMSDSKEDEYFSDGITDDILTQLSKISDLQVISRTSVMKYKNTESTIPEIAKELDAGSILEGSVRRSGNKVRITAQLINASSDEHIWAETFDRKIDDIFEVQSEIAELIAKNLEARLAPKEKFLIKTKPTNNIEAYAFCLKGRKYASKYTDEDNNKAIEFYKKALAIDSNYALAYAGLASAYDQKVRRYYYPDEWRDSAIAMSRKALSLNPDLAEGHSSLAKSYEAKGDYKLAKYHYEKAIRLNPNYYAAIYNLGVVYFNEGSLDKAYQLIRKSITLEPDNVFGYIVLGGIYQKFNCNNLALMWFNKALELEPKNLLVHVYLINQYILINDFNKAEMYANKLISGSPDWAFGLSLGGRLKMLEKKYRKALSYLAKSLAITGGEKEYDYGYILIKLNKAAEGKKIIKNEIADYIKEVEEEPDESSIGEKSLADMYAILGEREKSLKWLSKAVEKGWVEYRQNLVYPFMDSIKSELKFQKLISVMKRKVDSMKTIVKKKDLTWEECN
ncbi:invasion protein regulator [bacterium BMS3Abin04]|nr:invasion protein regulator [bacterium BMS3Abin04]